MKEKQIWKIVLFLALLILMGWAIGTTQFNRPNRFLQHIGTVVLLIPLAVDLRKKQMPLPVFICLALFTCFHLIGAKYVYSYVPYQEWFKALKINVITQRNHYDRFVHFSYGLLMMPVFCFYLRKWRKGAGTVSAVLIAWLLIQTTGMLYELFEWGIALLGSYFDGNKDWAKAAKDYVGAQDDIWDAQKDMALALLGSTITGLFLLCRRHGNPEAGKTAGDGENTTENHC